MSAYGLAAAVWTKDISCARTIARKLKAGTVWINCYGVVDPISPFGGYKQSGFKRGGLFRSWLNDRHQCAHRTKSCKNGIAG